MSPGKLTYFYRLNCVPPQIHMLNSHPPVWLYLGIRILWKSLRLNEVIRVEASSNKISIVIRTDIRELTLFLQEHKEVIWAGRRQPSANHEEGPQQNSIILVSWFWTSNLQNYKKINFCCLNHKVCTLFCYWSPRRLIHILITFFYCYNKQHCKSLELS